MLTKYSNVQKCCVVRKTHLWAEQSCELLTYNLSWREKSMKSRIILTKSNSGLYQLDHEQSYSKLLNLSFIFSISKIRTVFPGLILRLNEIMQLVLNINFPYSSIVCSLPSYSLHNKLERNSSSTFLFEANLATLFTISHIFFQEN